MPETRLSSILSRPARVTNLRGWPRLGAYLAVERVKQFPVIATFALATGLPWETIRSIESGRHEPTDSELHRIARELGLDGGALVTWADQIRAEVSPPGCRLELVVTEDD